MQRKVACAADNTMTKERNKKFTLPEPSKDWEVCEAIAEYSRVSAQRVRQLCLFEEEVPQTEEGDIRIVELFAGVGGFRVGFERASERFKTVWNNQWEPSTKRQDASLVYQHRFGSAGHSNEDIAKVPVEEIPDAEILCGGFPCQDYSVATTLQNSKGIEGKKGVLWWQIQRILRDKGEKAPKYLVLENVDRLLSSPAQQRGRDFAIILASLADLGYYVEWRVINAAEYGMPQRRKRTYMVAYHRTSNIAQQWERDTEYPFNWIVERSVLGNAFESKIDTKKMSKSEFVIDGNLVEVSENFNKSAGGKAASPFGNAGFMADRHVWSADVASTYDGPCLTLGQIILPDKYVPTEFFISDEDMPKWTYLKGGKNEKRVTKEGYEYNYSEGSMAFPDALDKPSRTIITGEGGSAPSRFKHVILTPSGRYRRLMPLELERLNMFPDNHTEGATDMRRAFLMGNALVTGIVERIGLILKERM